MGVSLQAWDQGLHYSLYQVLPVLPHFVEVVVAMVVAVVMVAVVMVAVATELVVMVIQGPEMVWVIHYQYEDEDVPNN